MCVGPKLPRYLIGPNTILPTLPMYCLQGLKYLIGPVSVSADLAWCPDPKKTQFEQALIDLNIKMQELR